MTDMQIAILKAITDNVPAGLNVRRKGDFANTGHLYVQNGFTTVLDIAYDFQSTYATVQVAGVSKTDLPDELARGLHETAMRPSEGGPWRGWYFRYSEGTAIERMLAAIAHLISARAALAPSASSAVPVGATVHVLEYVHRHGNEITVHASEDGVTREKAAIARLRWSEIKDADGVPDVAPDDDDEAARIYFDTQSERESEWVHSTVVKIGD